VPARRASSRSIDSARASARFTGRAGGHHAQEKRSARQRARSSMLY